MKDDDALFNATPEGLDRFVFNACEPGEEDPEALLTDAMDAFLEEPGGRIGRYKLLSILGEGGMGVVYLAEQERPVRRQVALKVIKPGMDSRRVLARFEAEQQALALMEHPHVARVHDAGLTPSGRPYFVMEHVRGVPVTEYCDKHRMTIEERLRLFLHVCEAVQHAHQKGIIHRDIKPSNILVTVEGEEAAPKVIDFGVARAVNQPLTERTLHTEQGQLVGTPEYMSPEQADLGNQDIDTRTDVYSLGVVLYELVAGVLPFDARTLREHGIDGVRRIICEEDPQTPSTRLSRTSLEEWTASAQKRRTNPRQLQRRLRGDLDWITLKAMEKDRTRRYASAGELAGDIVRHLSHEPIMAGRPRVVYRTRKFVRRNRALVTGFACVFAVLIAGVVVSLAFAVRAERARAEATAVAEFLQEDVFGAIDPYSRGSQQVPVKEILDAASRKVPARFGSAPLHEASIRKTLGVLYWKVDESEEAESHLTRSLEIFRRELGEQHQRTIELVGQLGRLCWARWRYTEAEQLLAEALQGKRRLLGSDHPDTVDAMSWLGWAHYANGRPKKAESLAAEAYEVARRTLGDSDKTTLEYMYRYGEALLLRGRCAEAKRVLRDAWERTQQVHIPVDPFTVYHVALLGRLYSRDGRYQEAEELLAKTLTTARDEWSEHSSAICHCVAALAENYARQGLVDEAEALMLDAVRRGEHTDEARPEIALQTKPYLPFFYLWQRRYDDGERCASEALRASLDSYGEEHPITCMSMIVLGMLYREQGRYDEAERQLFRAVDFTRHYCGDESVRTADALHQLAALHLAQGRYAEAEQLHLEILDIRRSLLVENHPHTLGTIKGLIALYSAWDRPQEARRWLEEVKAACTSQSGTGAYTPAATGGVRHDPAVDAYTLAAPTPHPWAIEQELDFSYPEPSSEMWHVCDDLHFAYKTLHGGGSITAKIEGIEPNHFSIQAGVMIRETLNPASPHASIVITPLGDVAFQYRTIELGATQRTYVTSNDVKLPHWVRLTRTGKLFAAQHSGDGVNWEPIQRNNLDQPTSVSILMGESVHIGLALASHNPNQTAEAKISNVTVTGDMEPKGEFLWSEDIGFQIVALPKE